MSKIKIKDVNTLVRTNFLNLYDLEFQNKTRKINHWMVASRKSAYDMKQIYLKNAKQKIDAVIIVAIHEETGKLVLINQFRVPVNGYIYELPAGLIDNNEDVESAVRRELKEETGLDLIRIDEKLTKKQVYMSPGMTDESVALVYCLCTGNLSSEYMEDDEEIEPMLISKDDAQRIVENESHRIDIKAYMILKDFLSNSISIK